jgi:hypothetical protein
VKEIPQLQLHCWINAEGVASHSPGLIAVFCDQPWDRIHSNLNPEGVEFERNPFRVDITFAFPQGWRKARQPWALSRCPVRAECKLLWNLRP